MDIEGSPAAGRLPAEEQGDATQAEKEYQAGLANHRAGKTDEAKQDFDNALNALLSSNLNIHSDDRLERARFSA